MLQIEPGSMENVGQCNGALGLFAYVDFVLESFDSDGADPRDWSWRSVEDEVDEMCLVWRIGCEPASINSGVDIGIVGKDPIRAERSHL